MIPHRNLAFTSWKHAQAVRFPKSHRLQNRTVFYGQVSAEEAWACASLTVHVADILVGIGYLVSGGHCCSVTVESCPFGDGDTRS